MRGSLLVAALAAVAAVPAPAAAVAVLDPELENRVLATGLDTPTAIAWTPDGRLLIAEKEGLLRLVDRRSAPLGRVILDISGRVSSRDDSGLLGLEVDRDFARNGFIYVSYAFDPNPAAPGAPKAARLSRFKLTDAGKIVRGRRGEKVILGLDSRSPCPPPANDVDCIPTDEGYHTIAAVRAAQDGTLWVSTGDGSGSPSASRAALRAYDEESLSGKLLHINRKGRGLRQHPFCPEERNLDLVCTKVFAMGFRNPFRFTLAPDGAPIVGDVGWGLREEIDVVEGGRNYGWPCYEGELRTPGFDAFQACQQVYAQEGTPDAPVRSAHEYERPPEGAAVIAGPLFTGSAPPPFRDAFFFGDYGIGALYRLTGGLGFSNRQVEPIVTGWRGVDLRLGPDGTLAYVDIAEGVVAEIAYAPDNKTPTAAVQAAPAYGALPLRVKLHATAEDPNRDELSYRWRLGDGERASGPTVRHTYRKRGTYVVRLVVRDRHGARTIAARRIFAGNTPPRAARILSPRNGYRYVTGRPVRLRAAARDPEDGRLRGRALRWRLVLRHDDHNHYVGQGSGRRFTFRPLRDHDANSYYKVLVVATDRGGLSQFEPPHEIELRPRTTRLSLDSQPPGAPISYGSEELEAPVERAAAVGHRTTVTAAASFEREGVRYEFSGWSDGAPRSRKVTIGPRPSRLTAVYAVDG